MKAGFKVGDLVWARVKNHPVWPSRIEPQPVEDAKKGHVYVYFFGAKPGEQYGWVANSSISRYNNKARSSLIQASTRGDFKAGVKEIEEEYEKMSSDSTKEPEQVESDPEKDESDETKADSSKRTRQPKKKFGIESVEGSSATGRALRVKRKAPSDPVENGGKHYKIKDIADGVKDDYNPTPNLEVSAIDKPDMLGIEFGTLSGLEPTTFTIGFLGLGIMGTGIVNNLIKSGHKVNLWSRDDEKCKQLKEKADQVKDGPVNVWKAPCDVIKESDIVFNCCSDPESAEKIVFGNCGVIHDSDAVVGKGFVEMTGIDPQTSTKICNAIQARGGRYLEAQMQGSREEAVEGTLVILAAGDNSLFNDCQSCFQAMGKTSLYLGEVGVATKVYLILQLIQGISLVGLAEGLVLADRCGISGKDIINIFNMTNMSSPYLRKKAGKIVNKDFKQVDCSIKNMQKDIRLALGLSDELMQPLMMASAANEVYKHSRKLGYNDHDCSCIYMKARY